jgi:hypothetical protein
VKARPAARTVLRSRMVARGVEHVLHVELLLGLPVQERVRAPRPGLEHLDRRRRWHGPGRTSGRTSPRRTSASGRVPRPTRRTGGGADRPGGQDRRGTATRLWSAAGLDKGVSGRCPGWRGRG